MRRAETICRSARLLTLIALGTILTGCSIGSFNNKDIYNGSRFGLRPDDAFISVLSPNPCSDLESYVKYAVNLKEAYRTRATQNRMWLYVAGITGLGVAAASGGLAAAGAAAVTIGLLALSGGFTAGFFATIDNAELANVYTVAANDIGTALANTRTRLARCSQSTEECGAELTYLSSRVTSARNTLETARTASAAGALARAAASKKLLDDEITKVQAQVEAEKNAKEAVEKKAAAATAQANADAQKAQAKADDQAAKNAADKKTEADSKAATSQADADAKKAQAEADKQAAKNATDKKTEADNKAATSQAVADAKKAQADADKQAANNATDKKTEADNKAKESTTAADEAQKKADAAKKAADDAEAKAKADADALAAATSPVSPKCLSPTGKALGQILSFTPDTVRFVKDKATNMDKATYVDAEVTNVDLRDIPNERLSIEIGGQVVSVTEKLQKKIAEPYTWIVRFVPPDKKPKDDESAYTPSLLYDKEILAIVTPPVTTVTPPVTLKYP